LVNLELSGKLGLAPERIIDTLIAIAPVIGTARIISAASSIVQGFQLANTSAEKTGERSTARGRTAHRKK
jgi:hypothetical protein